MGDNPNSKKGARIFAAAFATAVSDALGKAVGEPWPMEVMEGAEPSTRHGQPVHFRLSVDGALRGECFVEFYEPQVNALMNKVLGRPPVDDEAETALVKTLASATGGLRTLLTTQYGELNFRLDRVSGLAFGGMLVVPLAAPADPSGAPVLLYFDGQLVAALCAGSGGTGTGASDSPRYEPANLQMLMDVELNVSLRFGQRQLPLREVLELSSGSVVELDRMVDEPVELLLDGKVIARGEAVIVDGNYGLRVTEIPQPVATHLIH
ncbi:MAG: flagellar motor switch protein FliN [Acidobacteriota bacterium]